MDTQNKSGVKTTEFYVALANSVAGIFITLGYLTPTQADDLIKAVTAVIGGAMVISSMAIYIWGRIHLKSQSLKNSSIQEVLLTPGSNLDYTTVDPSGKKIPS